MTQRERKIGNTERCSSFMGTSRLYGLVLWPAPPNGTNRETCKHQYTPVRLEGAFFPATRRA